MLIVDSTVWVDYFRGADSPQAEWLHGELQIRPVALTDLILCEVLQGIGSEEEYRRVSAVLSELVVFNS